MKNRVERVLVILVNFSLCLALACQTTAEDEVVEEIVDGQSVDETEVEESPLPLEAISVNEDSVPQTAPEEEVLGPGYAANQLLTVPVSNGEGTPSPVSSNDLLSSEDSSLADEALVPPTPPVENDISQDETIDGDVANIADDSNGPRVYYFKGIGSIKSEANDSASGETTNQGDHFLGIDQGEWVMAVGRGWVKKAEVTTRPVGYRNQAKTWN